MWFLFRTTLLVVHFESFMYGKIHISCFTICAWHFPPLAQMLLTSHLYCHETHQAEMCYEWFLLHNPKPDSLLFFFIQQSNITVHCTYFCQVLDENDSCTHVIYCTNFCSKCLAIKVSACMTCSRTGGFVLDGFGWLACLAPRPLSLSSFLTSTLLLGFCSKQKKSICCSICLLLILRFLS